MYMYMMHNLCSLLWLPCHQHSHTTALHLCNDVENFTTHLHTISSLTIISSQSSAFNPSLYRSVIEVHVHFRF